MITFFRPLAAFFALTALASLLVGCDQPQGGSASPSTSRVLYVANGATVGSVPLDPAHYLAGAEAVVKGNSGALYRSGWHWVSWNTQADGMGLELGTGDHASIGNTDLTLYAHFAQGSALWATGRPNSGTQQTRGSDLKVDKDGNVHALLEQRGTSIYSYSDTVSVQALLSGLSPVVIKYDSLGAPLWARTATNMVTSSSSAAWTASQCAVDSLGATYVVGTVYSISSITFGPGVTLTLPATGANSYPFLVKYDADGTAVWARTLVNGPSGGSGEFRAVAVDSQNHVFVAGLQTGLGTFDYGNSVTSTISTVNDLHAVMCKYDTNGTAQTLVTVGATSKAFFQRLDVGSDDSIVATGLIWGTDTATFGPSVTASGSYSAGANAFVAKYDSSLNAQWARTASQSPNLSYEAQPTVDGSGNVYISLLHRGSGTVKYGADLVFTLPDARDYGVVLKYTSAGTLVWGRPIVASGQSEFTPQSVAVDSAGNLYVGGACYPFPGGIASVDLGNGVTVAPSSRGSVVKFRGSDGQSLWVQQQATGSNSDGVNGLGVLPSGTVVALSETNGQFEFAPLAMTDGYESTFLVAFRP